MATESVCKRREFLVAGTTAGTILWAPLAMNARAAEEPKATKPAGGLPEDVTPSEDLMREHGVLNRILLIYEEHLRRTAKPRELEPVSLAAAAKIIRTFIEDYHEKLEEEHIFPRFEKAGKLVDLVKVLREQHDAGRRLTDTIARLASREALKASDGRTALTQSLEAFIRMYRPHETREDTVLFPALRSLMSAKEFDEMGDQFEEREHKLFGEHGFEEIVAQVAEIEKSLGIYDLSQFTPKI